MSDSHDNLDALKRAVQYCNRQKVDGVLHAGDLVSPFVNRVLKDLQVNPGELCGWLTGKSTLALWDTQSNSAEIITV